MENTVIQYNAEKYPNFKEYLWFKEHEETLMRRYYGRYIVIKNEQIIGDYGSWRLARQLTVKEHKPGTFIIQHCTERDPRWAPRLNRHKIVTVNGK